MQIDHEQIMRQLGFSSTDVASVFDDSEQDTVAALERMSIEDVGAVVRRICPSITTEAERQVNDYLSEQLNLMHKVYAATVAVYAAHQSLRKNAQIGLYGPEGSPGTLYPPGTIFFARPRLSGVPQGTDFEFLPDYTFFRLFAEEDDASRGWHIVGNTVKFSDEIVSGIRGDVPFTSITNDVPAAESPLASMFKRSPKIPVRFQIAVRLDAATEQPFHGLTLEYSDTSCRANTKVFADNAEDLNFAGLTKLIIASVGDHIRRRPTLKAAPRTGIRTPVAATPFLR